MARNRTRYPRPILSAQEKSRRHAAAFEANIRTRKIGRRGDDYRRHVEISLSDLSPRVRSTLSAGTVKAFLLAGKLVTRHVTKGRLRVE
jgi:hypothetical protein